MTRWPIKAEALYAGWIAASGAPPPTPNALRLVLAQAQFETQAGDAWDTSHNWGACDLRGLTAAENAAFKVGGLKIGAWLLTNGTWTNAHAITAIGTLRGDSDPNNGKFRVWFAAFPTDALGATYMLRAGVRRAAHVFDPTPGAPVVYQGPSLHEVHAMLDEGADPKTYATALYLQGYFGGEHAGARPVGHRAPPFNAAELANIQDYANDLRKQLPSLDAGLAGWEPPGPYGAADPAAGDDVTANDGGESAPATDVGTNDGEPNA